MFKAAKHWQSESIDYDAIMKSIKIDHVDTSTKLKAEHSKSQKNNHYLYDQASSRSTNTDNLQKSLYGQSQLNRKNREQEYKNQIVCPKMDKQTIVNKNYIYSSIVHDDFSKQSCFQSIYRQQNAVANRSNFQQNRQQFYIYVQKSENSRIQNSKQLNHSENINNNQSRHPIRTPSKFKKFKAAATSQSHMQISREEISHSQQYSYVYTQSQNQGCLSDLNKQNMRNSHNCQSISLNPSQKSLQSKGDKQQHRYLSHTETSQKKIKPKRPNTQLYKHLQNKGRISPIFANHSISKQKQRRGKGHVSRENKGIQITMQMQSDNRF